MTAPHHLALYLPALSIGGAERVMLNLAGAFAADGHRVDLVLDRRTGGFLPQVPAAVTLHDLAARRTVLAAPKLAQWLRRHRPAAMLSALPHNNLTAIWAGALARLPMRLVLSEHAMATTLPRLSDRLLPWLMRFSYRRADAIVAVSAGVAAEVACRAALPLSRVTVIPNPVVGPNLVTLAAERLDHPWLAAGAPPVLLGVGRLAWEKDFATLLRAFARLRQSRLLRLVILGDGEQRAALEALIAELRIGADVLLPGATANPYAWMARAAALILSSSQEGFGNVLVEAMACGLPVVSTDCPSGPRAILDQGRFGRLVPVGDPEALAVAIADTLSAPSPATALRERAAAFSTAAIADRYLTLLLGNAGRL